MCAINSECDSVVVGNESEQLKKKKKSVKRYLVLIKLKKTQCASGRGERKTTLQVLI